MTVYYYGADRGAYDVTPETHRCIRLVVAQINGTVGDDRLLSMIRAMQAGDSSRKGTAAAERARCANIVRSQRGADTDERIRAIIDGINNGEDPGSP